MNQKPKRKIEDLIAEQQQEDLYDQNWEGDLYQEKAKNDARPRNNPQMIMIMAALALLMVGGALFYWPTSSGSSITIESSSFTFSSSATFSTSWAGGSLTMRDGQVVEAVNSDSRFEVQTISPPITLLATDGAEVRPCPHDLTNNACPTFYWLDAGRPVMVLGEVLEGAELNDSTLWYWVFIDGTLGYIHSSMLNDLIK